MATKFETTKLTPKTKRKLKFITKKTGETLYRLVDRLADEAIAKLKAA